MATVSLDYTVKWILTAALRQIGNTDPSTEQLYDAHRHLNLMLGEWACSPQMQQSALIPPAGYTSDNDVVDLPEGYAAAMVWGLAARLMAQYGVQDQLVLAMAKQSMGNVMVYNTRTAATHITAVSSVY